MLTLSRKNVKEKGKIALFIDADNAPASKIDTILSELARHGVVNIRKAYGNWKSPNIKPWEDVLHEFAIQPIQQFDLTKGKNATDIYQTDKLISINQCNRLVSSKVDGFYCKMTGTDNID